MDILIQVIGYGFIPLFGIIVASGIHEIYLGLKEHFAQRQVKIIEIPINFKFEPIVESFGFRRINSNFCKN